MGVSTFIQLLSDAELDAFRGINGLSNADGVFKALLELLCKRGFVGDPDLPPGRGQDIDANSNGEGVDILSEVIELLGSTAVLGDRVRLEQKVPSGHCTRVVMCESLRRLPGQLMHDCTASRSFGRRPFKVTKCT